MIPSTYQGNSGRRSAGGLWLSRWERQAWASPPGMAAITNYVALAATHFPLMQYSPIPKVAATTTIPDTAEAPNGVIVPGVGLNMRAITDGASKTLMICETIEPAMSSWYDGTTAWTTAINPNSMAKFPPSKADPSARRHRQSESFLVRAGGRLDRAERRSEEATKRSRTARPWRAIAPRRK